MSGSIRLAAPSHVSQPLGPEEAEKLLKDAPKRADAVESMAASVRRLTWVVGFGGAVVACLMAGTLAYVVTTDDPPRHHFSTIDASTGRVQPAVSAKDAPALFTPGTAHQYLRMFVETCAGYIHDLRYRNFARCTSLMAPEMQARYRDSFTSTNAQSPQNTVGAAGSVVPEGLSFYPIPTAGGRTDTNKNIQSWRIYYTAVLRRNAQEVAREPMVSVVHFEWRPDMVMTAEQRSWNAAGMRIVGYSFERDAR